MHSRVPGVDLLLTHDSSSMYGLPVPSFQSPYTCARYISAGSCCVHVDMHLCPRHTGEVEVLPVGAGINEEQVAGSAPLVRALVVERLELMWRNCEPHIDGSMGKPDPRYMEAGIRIVDRLSRLYRLDQPQAADNEPDSVSRVDKRELAAAGLAELEQKLSHLG